MRFNATIESVNSKRATVTLKHKGEWSGSYRIDLPSSHQSNEDALYELGYKTACQNAAVKGGMVDTYSRVFS